MLMTNGVSLCEGKKGCVSVITLLQSGVKGGRSAGGGEGRGGEQPADLLTASQALIQLHPGAAHLPPLVFISHQSSSSASDGLLLWKTSSTSESKVGGDT